MFEVSLAKVFDTRSRERWAWVNGRILSILIQTFVHMCSKMFEVSLALVFDSMGVKERWVWVIVDCLHAGRLDLMPPPSSWMTAPSSRT